MCSQLTSKLVSAALGRLAKSGINYVCSDCGTLIYHTGVGGAFEGDRVAFPAKQPAEVVDRIKSCPNCGRALNAEPSPDSVTVTVSLENDNSTL